MENDGQLSLQPEQSPEKAQLEEDWQDEQNAITDKYPVPRQLPQRRTYSPGAHTDRQLPSSAPRSEQSAQDVGASLGYGQGTEYAYLDASQPSQAIPVLRQLTGQHVRIRQPEIVSRQDSGAMQRVQIGRDALILTVAFVASSILGLLRGSLFTAVFGGSSAIFDAYNQAFLVPNLIFTMVAGGALSSAFIPVFKTYITGERDAKTAWHVTSSALNLATALLIVLALLMMIFARQIVPLYNHGVSAGELDLIISLTRIMLLQPIIMGAGVIITAVLNAHQRFLLYALGTVIYNVGIIGGFLIGVALAAAQHLHPGADTFRTIVVYAATCGVVLGALLQVGIQLPGLARVGMRYTFSFDWRHVGVQKIGKQMVPRIINAAMLNVSTAVDRNLILFLVIVVGSAVNGLISQYLLAFTLVLLPISIFGGTIATAAYPSLAENVVNGRMDRVRQTIGETLRSILFLSIPSSIGLIVLSVPIIQVLYEHGAFTLDNAQSMAVPLSCFALGLAALASVEMLTRSFYALQDSATPVIVSVAQFIFKIALSLLLLNPAIVLVQAGMAAMGTSLNTAGLEGAWGMGALALSTSIAGSLEALVLLWLLHQRIGGLQLRSLALFVGRVCLAVFSMTVILLGSRWFLDLVLVTNGNGNQSLRLSGILFALIKLLIELAVGVFVYLKVARFLKIMDTEELRPVRRLLLRLRLGWI